MKNEKCKMQNTSAMHSLRYLRGVLIVILIAAVSIPLSAQVLPEYGGILRGGAKPKGFRFPNLNLPPSQQSQPGLQPRSPQSLKPGKEPIGDVAFIHEGDVYTVTADAQRLRRLTDDGCNAFPVWSPGGKYIAFCKAEQMSYLSRTGIGGCLWITTPNGKNSKRLVPAKPNDAIYPVAWLPNGKGLLIATHYVKSDVRPTLKVVMLDGSAYPQYQNWLKAGKQAGFIHQMVDYDKNEFTHGQAAAISRDGAQIVFTGSNATVVDGPRLDLFCMNRNGSGLRCLAKLPNVQVTCLRWQPGGAKLLSAEERSVSGKTEAGIWLRGADGKASRKLVGLKAASFSSIDWAPKGDYVIYEVNDEDYRNSEYPAIPWQLSAHISIWVVKSNGAGKYKIIDKACNPSWRK